MAVGDAYVFPGLLTPVLTQLFFPKPPTTFLTYSSAVLRGENTSERKVISTRDQTHNHQVMSPTRLPLSHPGGAFNTDFSPFSGLLLIRDLHVPLPDANVLDIHFESI